MATEIDKQVAAATNVCDVPALVQSLADEVKRLQESDARQDQEELKQTGLLSSLQSQLLWVSVGAFMLGMCAMYVVLRAGL